jgi:hypothetical protein
VKSNGLRWIGVTGAALACAACSSAKPHPSQTTVGLNWTFVSVQGVSVTVQAIDGSCDDGPHAAVVEASTQVTISITTHPDGPASCDAMGHPKLVTVTLAAPLDHRRLTGCVPKGATPRDCNQVA